MDVKMDGPVLEEKSCFKILGLFSFLNSIGALTFVSIAKTAPKKIGALICSVNFLSPEVVLYPYNFSIRLCMEYCYYTWSVACNCSLWYEGNGYVGLYLHLLNSWFIIEIQPALAFSIGITLADVHLNWLNCLTLVGGPLVSLMHDFSVTILRCYKGVTSLGCFQTTFIYPPNLFPLLFLVNCKPFSSLVAV